mmetsp:Transcript_50518/g.126851  ORF Transcript_50518/g.126851 Transcript_50518/m.126851 type:complete len:246 (-) Transcript_50518:780-1517(-)
MSGRWSVRLPPKSSRSSAIPRRCTYASVAARPLDKTGSVSTSSMWSSSFSSCSPAGSSFISTSVSTGRVGSGSRPRGLSRSRSRSSPAASRLLQKDDVSVSTKPPSDALSSVSSLIFWRDSTFSTTSVRFSMCTLRSAASALYRSASSSSRSLSLSYFTRSIVLPFPWAAGCVASIGMSVSSFSFFTSTFTLAVSGCSLLWSVFSSAFSSVLSSVFWSTSMPPSSWSSRESFFFSSSAYSHASFL